jgi:hypothetical protein
MPTGPAAALLVCSATVADAVGVPALLVEVVVVECSVDEVELSLTDTLLLLRCTLLLMEGLPETLAEDDMVDVAEWEEV